MNWGWGFGRRLVSLCYFCGSRCVCLIRKREDRNRTGRMQSGGGGRRWRKKKTEERWGSKSLRRKRADFIKRSKRFQNLSSLRRGVSASGPPARGRRRRLRLIVVAPSSSSSSATSRPPELGKQASSPASPRRRGPAAPSAPLSTAPCPSSRGRRRRRRSSSLRGGPPLLLGARLHVQRLHRGLDRLEVGPVLGPARPARAHHLCEPRRAARRDGRPEALLDDADGGLQGGQLGVGDFAYCVFFVVRKEEEEKRSEVLSLLKKLSDLFDLERAKKNQTRSPVSSSHSRIP